MLGKSRMKKSIWVSILLVLFSVSLNANVLKGPYLIYEGSNTEMEVLWQLDSTQSCTIDWGYGTATTAETGSGTWEHQHIVTITGLTPATHYAYTVSCDTDTVGSGSFTTAPADNAQNVKLLVYGDTRTYPANHDEVNAQMINTYTNDPEFQTLTLHSGDWVGNAESENDWDTQYFDASYQYMHEFQANMPVNGIRGNHEGNGGLFAKYFPYPRHSGSFYLSYDYGPVHIAVIDQYTDYSTGSAQYNWLQNDLASSTKKWKFIVLHEPGWSAGGNHENNSDVQNYIQPLAVANGVSMIFSGHNHYYARADVDGVQHITTGGGGAPLYSADPTYPNIVATAMVHHFCEVNIMGNDLYFTARDKNGNVLDTVQLNPDADIIPPIITNPASEPAPRILADINGDDMADIIGFGSNGVSVALSNGSGFSSVSLWVNDFGYNQGWTTDKSLRKMADVDGDGLADVVGFGNNGVSVALSNGTGFDKASLWVNDFGYNQGWRNDKGLRIMADVNGDGLADIVGFGNNGVSVALSNGTGFDKASLWVNDFGYNQGWRNDKGLRMMTDVNGDGKADIVGFGNAGVSVALSNSNSFVNAQRWVNDFGYNQGWRNDKGLRFMSDVNGDGKADIVGFGNAGVSVALSNGNSFVNAQRWVNDFGYNQGWRNEKGLRMMSDVNGDGKADIVGFGNAGVSVAYSNGNSFTGTSRKIDNFGYNQGWRNDKHLRLMADVDGDSAADVVGFGNGGVSVSTSTGNDFDSASSWLNDFGYDQGWKVDFSPYQE